MQVGHGKEFALWNDDYNWLSMAGTISVKSLWQPCGLGIVINLIIMGKETAWIYKDRKILIQTQISLIWITQVDSQM